MTALTNVHNTFCQVFVLGALTGCLTSHCSLGLSLSLCAPSTGVHCQRLENDEWLICCVFLNVMEALDAVWSMFS